MNPTDTTQAPVLDAAIVAECRTLMQDKYAKILGYFVEDSAMYVDQIEQAFAQRNADALVPPAHTLKSSARQIGAVLLSTTAAHIERAARDAIQQQESLEQLQPIIAPLRGILEATLAELAQQGA